MASYISGLFFDYLVEFVACTGRFSGHLTLSDNTPVLHHPTTASHALIRYCNHHRKCCSCSVQVLPQDVDPQYGIAHSPLGPSPSQSPLARPFGAAPTGAPSAYTSAVARSSSLSSSDNLARLSTITSQHDTPNPVASEQGAVPNSNARALGSRSKSGSRQYSGAEHMGSGVLPPVAEVQTASERSDSEELSAAADTASQGLTLPSQQDSTEWTNAEASETASQTETGSLDDASVPSHVDPGNSCSRSPFKYVMYLQAPLLYVPAITLYVVTR